MTPLRLELEGFTCFRDPTVVDLTELEVGLFAIAGPTGAGKSTLLDAITYALYGQTARLGSRGLDALMSPGAEEMTVQLTFATATGTYRVSRFAWQRASRVERQTRIEKLEAGENWRQLPESEKLADANKKLIEVIGLDYDGFTRAVLLPQGAFDEFLRGDAVKRRKLLTVLLGLDRVQAMAKLAGRYAKDAEATIKAIETRLREDYDGATPERRRALNDEREAAAAELAHLREQIERLASRLAELEQLRELDLEMRALEDERRKLEGESEAMAAAAVRRERAQRAQLVLPLIGSAEAAHERFRGAQRDLASATGRREELAAKRRTRAAEAAEARTHFESRAPEIAEHLERLAGVAPLAARLFRVGGSLDLADRAEAAQPFDEERWEQIEALRQRLPGVSRLRANLAEGRRGLSAAEQSSAELEREIAAAERRLTQLVEQGREARAHSDRCSAELAKVRAERGAAALREGLEIGDPCPICGRPIEHLAAHRVEDLEAAARRAADAEQAVKELLQRHAEESGALGGLRKRLEDRRSDSAKRKGEIEHLAGELAESELPFAAAGFAGDDREAQLTRERDRLLAVLAATIREVTRGEDPDRLRSRLQRERTDLERALGTLQNSLAEADRSLERIEAEIASSSERIRAYDADRSQADAALAAGLARSGFSDSASVRAAEMSEVELEALAGTLAEYAARRETTERRYAEVRERLAGRSYDAADHAAHKQQHGDLTARVDTLQRRIGSLAADLERLEQMLEKAKSLREELAGAQSNFDIYRQLSLDLRGDNFQEFLMTRVQSELARRASHIVRTVTDGRYDLRLDGGEYQVLDAWSDGDPRSARTLSGGETFIASLALALALSDTVAGNHSLGALFLDEGFGSLDRETLDAVALVLEALTHEGRMVGIITHVQELSDRLPARLLVHKGPHGSAVQWDG